MTHHRATLNSPALASRLRTALPQPQQYDRSFSVPRVQRQLIRRASIPQHRQPRVRLGKPTSPHTYVHWQDYLDISDLHKKPKITAHSNASVYADHHETMSEMMERYRGVAQDISDKVSYLLHGEVPATEVVEVIEPEILGN